MDRWGNSEARSRFIYYYKLLHQSGSKRYLNSLLMVGFSQKTARLKFKAEERNLLELAT
ncbi:MAG: hypothetical protein KME43_22435 [Myxacorys chilensis ATA2-1-KO14]|nr:hypothetical protein [Myxacorys chilensis ATA2-1-KO14]